MKQLGRDARGRVHEKGLDEPQPQNVLLTVAPDAASYGRIGFACTHKEEGFMIVERDAVQLHLHPSNEPLTRHGAFWIRVSNIEALYQEYLAANVITSSQVKAQPWGFKQFHICDPFRNIFIFAESLTEEEESAAGYAEL